MEQSELKDQGNEGRQKVVGKKAGGGALRRRMAGKEASGEKTGSAGAAKRTESLGLANAEKAKNFKCQCKLKTNPAQAGRKARKVPKRIASGSSGVKSKDAVKAKDPVAVARAIRKVDPGS